MPNPSPIVSDAAVEAAAKVLDERYPYTLGRAGLHGALLAPHALQAAYPHLLQGVLGELERWVEAEAIEAASDFAQALAASEEETAVISGTRVSTLNQVEARIRQLQESHRFSSGEGE